MVQQTWTTNPRNRDVGKMEVVSTVLVTSSKRSKTSFSMQEYLGLVCQTPVLQDLPLLHPPLQLYQYCGLKDPRIPEHQALSELERRQRSRR